jgi:hypothetical protein
VQKLLYAILITSRKLRHNFDDHMIMVITNFSLGDILHNRDAIGHISKWVVELGASSSPHVRLLSHRHLSTL